MFHEDHTTTFSDSNHDSYWNPWNSVRGSNPFLRCEKPVFPAGKLTEHEFRSPVVALLLVPMLGTTHGTGRAHGGSRARSPSFAGRGLQSLSMGMGWSPRGESNSLSNVRSVGSASHGEGKNRRKPSHRYTNLFSTGAPSGCQSPGDLILAT